MITTPPRTPLRGPAAESRKVLGQWWARVIQWLEARHVAQARTGAAGEFRQKQSERMPDEDTTREVLRRAGLLAKVPPPRQLRPSEAKVGEARSEASVGRSLSDYVTEGRT